MSASRRSTLLATGWLGFGLLICCGGCQVHLAFGEKDADKADAITRNSKQGTSSSGVQQVAYQQSLPNIMNGTPGGTPAPNYMHGSSESMLAPMPMGPSGMMQPGGPSCGPNGCGGGSGDPTAGGPVPTEKVKTSHPPYIIEPPDILLLQPIRLIPKPPYTVGPFDVLLIRAAKPLANEPIEGTYPIGPDGTINLGYSYGLVAVGGLTLVDVEKVIRGRLAQAGVVNPSVAIGLAQYRGVQQVRGEHLVRQDGTIGLGSYGCVYVTGLTLDQAKVAIERHLARYLQDPEISVDVGVYNSKSYYIITDGAGYGQQVYRLPIMGNETVLDAISSIQGLPAVASKKHIWLARPAPPNHSCSQILPVDWGAITQAGVTATNYQIFPGDRIYVQSDWLICLDNNLAKVLSPFQRLFTTAILGGSAYSTLRNPNAGNGNTGAALLVR